MIGTNGLAVEARAGVGANRTPRCGLNWPHMLIRFPGDA